MSSIAILGSTFGDEAKAKIVDVLAEDYDIVVRFQGGSNAGHTIKTNNQSYILHLIPSGILYEGKKCVIGSGVVIDLFGLIDEINNLKSLGIDFKNRFFIDERAFIVLPIHKELDSSSEDKSQKIGTTKRGIGPSYMDAIGRFGIRFGDLFEEEYLRERIFNLYKHHQIEDKIKIENLIKEINQISPLLKEYKTDSVYMLNEEYDKGANIVFEGAQGSLLDVYFGTYPYVTSSHTIAGGISVGLGLPTKKIDKIIGVYKSYFTRVGEGPFPTELFDEIGEQIRTQGNEFGSTTGRPRRCGWFDAVLAKYSSMINGFDEIALTLLDVLTGLKKIKICTHYEINGEKIKNFISNPKEFSQAKPVFIELDGWDEDISKIKSYDELPINAKRYIQKIEELIGVPVKIVSVGADRKQTLFL